jgi:hypothetical protein
MTLAEILSELSARKGRPVRSSDYPSLRAMLEDWWAR